MYERLQLRQEQAQLQNNLRTTLLQLAAGLLVIAGAAATWRQVKITREGHIYDRLATAIGQIGDERAAKRIGAINALDHIVRNSSEDSDAARLILCDFLRNRSPWIADSPHDPGTPAPTLDEFPWLQIADPDVHAAVVAFARRPRFFGSSSVIPHNILPSGARFNLSQVDLRRLRIYRAEFVDTQFRHANFAQSWLYGTRFLRSDLESVDLRGSNLQKSRFVRVNLSFAHLDGADLRGADLRGADLHGAHLRGADLRGADLRGACLRSADLGETDFANVALKGAIASADTIWPAGIDDQSLTTMGVML